MDVRICCMKVAGFTGFILFLCHHLLFFNFRQPGLLAHCCGKSLIAWHEERKERKRQELLPASPRIYPLLLQKTTDLRSVSEALLSQVGGLVKSVPSELHGQNRLASTCYVMTYSRQKCRENRTLSQDSQPYLLCFKHWISKNIESALRINTASGASEAASDGYINKKST